MDTNQLTFNKNIALSVFLSIVLVVLLPTILPTLIFAAPSDVTPEIKKAAEPYKAVIEGVFNIVLPLIILASLGFAIIQYVVFKNMGRMMMFLGVVVVGSVIWAARAALSELYT